MCFVSNIVFYYVMKILFHLKYKLKRNEPFFVPCVLIDKQCVAQAPCSQKACQELLENI